MTYTVFILKNIKNVPIHLKICNLKTILYYITDHGLGHATRSVAIIRELKKLNVRLILRNSNCINFLRESLPDIQIIPGITDVGPIIAEDGVSIDRNKSKTSLKNWIDNMDKFVKQEKETIVKINPDLVISDVSAVPIKASYISNKPSIVISNFCWSDVLDFLELEQLSKLITAYEMADFAIQLPFGTDMKPFKIKKKAGIVCRRPTRTPKEIHKILGLSDNSFKILVHLGNQYKISFKGNQNTEIISTGANIDPFSHQISPWIEGQDLIFASDLVICKLGYGMVTECLTNGTPFVYLSDPNHIEQNFISKGLEKLGLDNRITKEDLYCLDLEKITKRQIVPKKLENETNIVVKMISEML